jgi:non-specific serine/threonine protein kinase
MVGRQLGPYQILSLLGAGGMGEVYLAQDSRLDRTVAMKILPTELASDPDRMRRFIREARAASALKHPNVATIHDIGESEGVHFIAMEYVEGQTLTEKVKGSPMDPVEITEIGIQVADALDEAHTRGIIHRDIKPANLMLTPRGQIKVLDFGLAKVTRPKGQAVTSDVSTMAKTETGVVMGTMQYMSPEQVLGREVDHRSDLFSLGVVLYEMTTGRLPFSGASVSETMDRILHSQPDAIARFNYNVPAELERIVRKCLEKDRERRCQSARELLVDLRNLKRDSDSGADAIIGEGREVRHRLLTPSRLLLISVLVMCVVATLVYFLLFRRVRTGVPHDIKSLAVLPLENLSGDSTQEYFADGMTEALITDLGKIGALRVISRSAVMKYKGANRPPREISRELKVDAMVEGSVVRAADRVRITAHLIHPAMDQQLWAESYERDLRDIPALQREIARTIAAEIRVKLTPQEQAHLAKARPVTPEAYDYYLRGKFLFGRRNKSDNEAAIEMLERAVNIDPSFAAAHALLAHACVEIPFYYAPQERKQWEEKAYVAVQKALSLDPDLPEAYFARGRLLWTPSNHFPHERTIQEYRRALALNPSSDEAQVHLAGVYNHIGLLDKGLQEAQKVAAIDPISVRPQVQIGNALLWQGRYEEALTVWQRIPEGALPSVVGPHLAWILFQLGRKEEASAKIAQLLKTYPQDSGGAIVGLRALLLAADGRICDAEKSIQSAAKNKDFGHFHHTAYWIACAYARMNKPEDTIHWLQEAADNGFPCYPLFERDSNLDPVRKDPRFIAFLDRLKKQWEHYKATLS